MREITHHSEELGSVLMLNGHVDLVPELRRRRVKQLSKNGFRPQVGVALAVILDSKGNL